MAAEQIYPYSTQDGKSVPIDIIKPLGALYYEVDGTLGEYTLPDGWDHCYFYSDIPLFIQFLDTLAAPVVADTQYLSSFFLPPETVLVVNCTPGAVKVARIGSASGYLAVTWIQQWAALAQPKQTTFG